MGHLVFTLSKTARISLICFVKWLESEKVGALRLYRTVCISKINVSFIMQCTICPLLSGKYTSRLKSHSFCHWSIQMPSHLARDFPQQSSTMLLDPPSHIQWTWVNVLNINSTSGGSTTTNNASVSITCHNLTFLSLIISFCQKCDQHAEGQKKQLNVWLLWQQQNKY